MIVGSVRARVDTCYHMGTLEVIPPVASPAGEGGKPPGGGHLRVALFAFPFLETRS